MKETLRKTAHWSPYGTVTCALLQLVCVVALLLLGSLSMNGEIKPTLLSLLNPGV